jgi:hypothetical protein
VPLLLRPADARRARRPSGGRHGRPAGPRARTGRRR